MYAQKVGRAQEDCGIRSITAIVIVQATEMQPLTQQAVLNMIWEEMRDKIAILIIHRFNCMLERADKIIVLENGEIEDIGIHEELLRHHGLYYRLYMVQKEMSLSDE